MSSNSILPGTTLCAIVRDEMINPSSEIGITDFVGSTVPYVEQALFLDTGSRDGTYEELQRLRRVFRNLHVEQREFEGYAEARNRVLRGVRTERVLFLDADERIRVRDFQILARAITEHPDKCFNFDLIEVFLDKQEEHGPIHNPRLFPMSIGPVYDYPIDSRCEYLFLQNESRRTPHQYVQWNRELKVQSPVPIYHFKPSREGEIRKGTELYYSGYRMSHEPLPQPSSLPSFKQWKQPNGKREAYRW